MLIFDKVAFGFEANVKRIRISTINSRIYRLFNNNFKL